MGGKAKALPDGHPRRMSDGKNAWRKMSYAQRRDFMGFIEPDLMGVGFDLRRDCPDHGFGCHDARCDVRDDHEPVMGSFNVNGDTI